MWQERFNLGIESIEQRLGSFEKSQEQGGLLLAFLFSRRNEMDDIAAVVHIPQRKTML
jgi:hypothetical protein